MRTKHRPLAEAIAENVKDGDCVFIGGFGHAIPFAAGHELIRQGRKDLTLCRTGTDILFDQLIAAGCVAKVIFGYLGNPGIGLAHAFRRAVENKEIEAEDWTNFTMLLRLHAAALGVPYIPTRVLRAGDIVVSDKIAEVRCPFTDEPLTAIPALRPDVALIHAQRADEQGNVQMWGLTGDTAEGAKASKRIVASVEEIVPVETIRADANRTILPGYMVTAVCAVPWGAHPSYVQDYYGRDDAVYFDYDRIARSPDDLAEFLGEWVAGVESHKAYVEKLGAERRARLASEFE